MNKFVNVVPFIIIILVVFLLIGIELKIRDNKQIAPETVLIKVLKSDGKTPEQNASCKADIITKEKTIEDKSLNKIENMFEYIDVKKWDIPDNKGYYELKTGLENYSGKFEIKIVCKN